MLLYDAKKCVLYVLHRAELCRLQFPAVQMNSLMWKTSSGESRQTTAKAPLATSNFFIFPSRFIWNIHRRPLGNYTEQSPNFFLAGVFHLLNKFEASASQVILLFHLGKYWLVRLKLSKESSHHSVTWIPLVSLLWCHWDHRQREDQYMGVEGEIYKAWRIVTST